uniref:Uncharacterized protein n=1 Tax=Rhizophora mucronata TaxID=61149 RepID=A0A2P2P848_RHIMU
MLQHKYMTSHTKKQ